MSIQRYLTNFNRLPENRLTKWAKIAPAIASDCMNRSHVMSGRISPLSPEMRLCGHAVTVTGMVGDNSAAHVAISLAEPGDILVIDGRGHIETAVWGGIMTRAAMKQSIQGIVIDGAVRDAAEIRELSFPVFNAGTCPAGPSKGFGGIINGHISCAGASVKPGDLILGDEDGVAVVPLEHESQVFEAAVTKIAEEEQTNADTGSGTLPAAKFGLTAEIIK